MKRFFVPTRPPCRPEELAMLRAYLVLLTCTATAWAEPSPSPTPTPTPKPTQTCVVSGGVVYQYELVGRNDQHTTTVIRASGAWSHTHREAGKVVQQLHGCLSPTRLKEIRVRLANAQWIDDRRPRNCRSRGQRTITVADRIVYRSDHCHELMLESMSNVISVHILMLNP